MAYSTDNPPALISQMVGKNGGSKWMYDSTDAASAVRVDGYITDGAYLGMKVGDSVEQIDTAGGSVNHNYTVVAVNANGSVDLSDGTASSTTDTD